MYIYIYICVYIYIYRYIYIYTHINERQAKRTGPGHGMVRFGQHTCYKHVRVRARVFRVDEGRLWSIRVDYVHVCLTCMSGALALCCVWKPWSCLAGCFPTELGVPSKQNKQQTNK